MHHSEEILFNSDDDILQGTIDWNVQKDKPTILFIHGSHPSSSSSFNYFMDTIFQTGKSCLRFDLSGHGESTGDLEAPIPKFIGDAKAALGLMDAEKPLTIIGGSMGGHIAVALTEYAPVENLVLVSPALYSAQSDHLSYGKRWKSMLREPQQDAPILNVLDRYTGNMLHIIGQNDNIIPPAVTKLFKQHSKQMTKAQFYTVPGADHVLRFWLQEKPAEKEKMLTTIRDFIATPSF